MPRPKKTEETKDTKEPSEDVVTASTKSAPEVAPKPEKSSDGETVTMSRKDFDAVLDRIERLESQNSGTIDVDDEGERTVRVRFVDGKLISDVRNARQTGVNARGEAIMVCDVTLVDEDGKEEERKDFDYVSIRELPQEELPLVRTDIKEKVVKSGRTVPERYFDESAGVTRETGRRIALKEVIPTAVFVVEYKGKEITLKNPN